ncbi:hypothetical protein Tco_1128822 [Tanacetum coccineum]
MLPLCPLQLSTTFYKTTISSWKIEGLKLNKPKATFVYRPKISEPARTMEMTSDDIDLFKLKNQFDSLRDQDDLLKENEVGGILI